MRRPSDFSGLCLIIDHDLLQAPAEKAMSTALSAGVGFFQYRNKSGTGKKIYEVSLQLARMARAAGALFVVNDRTDIAAAVDADGVHLGQDDLPIECARKLLGGEKIIGISTHDVQEARAAEAAGADYVGFGAVFGTSSKQVDVVYGIEKLADVKKSVTIPVVAIGGINHDNVRDVMGTGADGAAVISAVLCAPDMQHAAQEMMRIMKESKRRL
jgi:thiamine-phosphate pyrophosphorylase